MSSGIEAIGDAATGALVGAAVEPHHGAGTRAGHDGAHAGAHGGQCLNCGATLTGKYCQNCGQSEHVHRSLSGFGHDILHAVFHFEGKFWDTLPMLIFKPGELTRRYIHGERAKFVSPMAMFLFCVFLMFAVVGGLAGKMHAPEASRQALAMSVDDMRASIATNKELMAQIEEDQKDKGKTEAEVAALDAKYDALDSDTEDMQLALGKLTGGKEGSSWTVFGFKTGNAVLDERIRYLNENPNLFLYQLKTSAYKYSWMLIPISTPLVWLMFFWKRQYKFYDHLVFVTFSLIFMSLFVTALTLASWAGVGGSIVALAAIIIPLLHMYKQLRGAYLCGRAMALVRTFVLSIFACLALSLYLTILLAMGVMA